MSIFILCLSLSRCSDREKEKNGLDGAAKKNVSPSQSCIKMAATRVSYSAPPTNNFLASSSPSLVIVSDRRSRRDDCRKIRECLCPHLSMVVCILSTGKIPGKTERRGHTICFYACYRVLLTQNQGLLEESGSTFLFPIK